MTALERDGAHDEHEAREEHDSRDDTASPAGPADPGMAAFLASLPRRLRVVNARSPLGREDLPDRGGSVDDPVLSEATARVWDAEKASARALAARYRALADLHVHEGEYDQYGEASDVDGTRAALGLRTTYRAATYELRDAHQAVHTLPRTLDLLEIGAFPSWWFTRMLRTARDLSDDSRLLLDATIATWTVDITAERFITLLNALTQLLQRREQEPDPEDPGPVRSAELHPDTTEGTGAIMIRGPIPEILARWKDLDETARAIQTAQRQALADGTTIPYDLDDLAATTGRAVPLDRLRYHLLMTAQFDTDGVRVPAGRFRLNITVPALTLLGASDAPGMVEGVHPIPPEMARSLAGDCPTWQRVLTDPATGAFLPLPAQKYQPTTAMLEHLRHRNAACAVPGCTRPTAWASECDHIIEYDHHHPTAGGPTTLENLHLLCWQHHLDKTAGRLDVTRLPTRATSTGKSRWRIGPHGDETTTRDDTDIATLLTIAQLETDWQRHLTRRATPRPRSPDPDPGPGSSDPAAPGAPPRSGTDPPRPGNAAMPPGPPEPEDHPPPF